jgi:hypothetical protein
MAYTILPNLQPATGGEAIWRLKEALVAAGWVVAGSGTGTGGGYSAAGDVHAPGGAYAGTLDLGTAWFRLRAPVSMSPRREFVFFLPTAGGLTWRILYSSDGTGFTGGTPSATARPTATDEQNVFNAPSSTNPLLPANLSYRTDIWIGDAASGFNWFFGCRQPTDGFGNTNLSGYRSAIFFDVLVSASCNTADVDQAVVGVQSPTGLAVPSTSPWLSTISPGASVSGIMGWFKKGLAGATWTCYPFVFPANTDGGQLRVRAETGYNGYDADGLYQTYAVWYWRIAGSQGGRKGKSTLFRTGQTGFGFMRLNGGPSPAAMTILNIGYVVLPWDGATKPIW